MRDQTQAWSDRPEPVREGVPEQRPPAEDAAEAGAAAPWAPPPERVAPGDAPPSAWTGSPDEAGVPVWDHESPDADAPDGDRAVGVASVPETAPDGAARDEEARDEEARDAEAGREEARDAEEHEPRLVDNGDDDPGALYRTEAEEADATAEDRADEDRAEEDRAAEDRAEEDRAEEDRGAEDRAEEDRAAEDRSAEAGGEAPGGVPADAVSAADAPVPAAAYQTPRPEEAGEAEPSGEAAPSEEDAQAGEAAEAGPAEELMPGDVPQEPVSALFDDARSAEFRDRWQQVQLRFVDDPRSAADQARALVDDVFTALHEALTSQRGSLDSWQSGPSDDTEQLRVAVRRYRDFLDRMLGL